MGLLKDRAPTRTHEKVQLSHTPRAMVGRQWCRTMRCDCGTSAKIPSSASRSSLSVTDHAESWLAGHTCLLCYPLALELVFLHCTEMLLCLQLAQVSLTHRCADRLDI